MTIVYGLTEFGFVPKPLSVCKEELENKLRAAFGQSIDLAPQSVYGQFVGIMSEREAELWDMGQAVYSANDPDAASGAALDAVSAITGTLRNAARQSSAILTCTGTPTTALASGRVVSVQSVGTKFATQSAVTIAAATAWAPSTAYVIGDRRTNDGKIYRCITSGTSAGSGGPTGTGTDITDGTAHWRWLGNGTGYVDVSVLSQEVGPWVALAYTLNVIETPVSGWNGATNILDAAPGANTEDDPSLRTRREEELVSESEATLDAIHDKVSKVGEGTNNPVEAVKVFHNTTMVTNADGLPPKSVEVLVQGGLDADILKAVFGSVAAGIETYGNQSGIVVDKSGNDQTVHFSRPDELEVYVILDIVADMSEFSVTGAADIAAKIGALNYSIAKDVTASAILKEAWATGVLSIDLPKIGLAPSPATSATIVVDVRERAVFDSSRVTVNVTPGTP